MVLRVEMRKIVMPTMKYIIPGVPIPLQRPRYGASQKPYDVQKFQKQECRNFIEDQHGAMPFYTSVIRMDILFVFPIPKTSADRADGIRNSYHPYRPDIDNCTKFYIDCCNGITYRDDCIISEIHVAKIYGDTPRTEFTIIPLMEKYDQDKWR